MRLPMHKIGNGPVVTRLATLHIGDLVAGSPSHLQYNQVERSSSEL